MEITISHFNSNPPIIQKSRNHKIEWPSSPISLYWYPKNQTIKARKNVNRIKRFTVFAVTEGSAKKSTNSEEEAAQDIPSWAKPDSEEIPPWAKNETQKSSSGFEPPFFVYLLASAITAIASIGSVFEYVNQRPVFGVLDSDSIFYAPVLGFFAFTGIPTAAFLWFKSVEVANKEAEEQDRMDGYR